MFSKVNNLFPVWIYLETGIDQKILFFMNENIPHYICGFLNSGLLLIQVFL
jgi:hypothetical protein